MALVIADDYPNATRNFNNAHIFSCIRMALWGIWRCSGGFRWRGWQRVCALPLRCNPKMNAHVSPTSRQSTECMHGMRWFPVTNHCRIRRIWRIGRQSAATEYVRGLLVNVNRADGQQRVGQWRRTR